MFIFAHIVATLLKWFTLNLFRDVSNVQNNLKCMVQQKKYIESHKICMNRPKCSSPRAKNVSLTSHLWYAVQPSPSKSSCQVSQFYYYIPYPQSQYQMASLAHMTEHPSYPFRGQGTIPVQSRGKKPGEGTQKRNPFLSQENIRPFGSIGLKTTENKHTYSISLSREDCIPARPKSDLSGTSRYTKRNV